MLVFRYLIFYDIIRKQSGDWNTPTMIRQIWKEKRSPLKAKRGPFCFVASVCTVLLLISNRLAAARTVVRCSMI